MEEDYIRKVTIALRLLRTYEKILAAQEKGTPTIEAAGVDVPIDAAVSQFRSKYHTSCEEMKEIIPQVQIPMQRILRHADRREYNILNDKFEEAEEDLVVIRKELPRAISPLEKILQKK